MNVQRINEIKAEINWLATQGREAARAKNLPRSRELLAKTWPLVAELARLTGDKKWSELADEGARLSGDFNNRRDH